MAELYELKPAEARAVLRLDARRKELAQQLVAAQEEVRAVLDALAAKYGLQGDTPILGREGDTYYLQPREEKPPEAESDE